MVAVVVIVKTATVFMNMYQTVDNSVSRPPGGGVANQSVWRFSSHVLCDRQRPSNTRPLALVSAEIVRGPGAGAAYMLKTPSERSNAALKELHNATAIVESAIFLNQQAVHRNGRKPVSIRSSSSACAHGNPRAARRAMRRTQAVR